MKFRHAYSKGSCLIVSSPWAWITVSKPLDPPLAKQKMALRNSPTANFYPKYFLEIERGNGPRLWLKRAFQSRLPN